VSALTLYDGVWSVVIVTRSGACDPSYRVNVQIARGQSTVAALRRCKDKSRQEAV
jgi:hypothetical protein